MDKYKRGGGKGTDTRRYFEINTTLLYKSMA